MRPNHVSSQPSDIEANSELLLFVEVYN